MEALSHKAVLFLIRMEVAEEEDKEIYAYGLRLIFSSLASVMTMVIIAVAFGWLKETVLFLAVMISLRSFAGGYHAPTYLKCYMITVLAYIMVLVLDKVLPIAVKAVCYLPLLGVADMVLFFIAPVQSQVNPKIPQELKANRKKLYYRVLIFHGLIVLFWISAFTQISSWAFCISGSFIVSIAFLLTAMGCLFSYLKKV